MVLSMSKEPKNKEEDVLCDHKEAVEVNESKQSKGGLSINVNLEGHKHTIHIIVWNPVYK